MSKKMIICLSVVGALLLIAGIVFLCAEDALASLSYSYKYSNFLGSTESSRQGARLYGALYDFSSVGSWPCIIVGGLLVLVSAICSINMNNHNAKEDASVDE